MQEEIYNRLKQCYIESEEELFGTKPSEIEVLAIRNHVIFLVKGSPTIIEITSTNSIRGYNIHRTLYQFKRDEFQILLKQKLSEIVGLPVSSVESDIYHTSEEKMELVNFNCDIESRID